MKFKEEYDIVIIGSGLGGLVCATIMAREGRSVCVLEKNNQYGGNLQTFVRDRSIFDTGIHYIGGLGEGENLNKFFTYLGLMDELKLQKLDKDRYDVITFDNDKEEYSYAQGFENFVEKLTIQFPKERAAIQAYCDGLRDICEKFPLYNLRMGGEYDEDLLSLKARDFIDSLTENKKLRSVLAGTNFLYAGDGEKTPLYVHALATMPYIKSSWRCVNGGSQISKILIKEIRKHGGDAFRHQEVIKFGFEGKEINAVMTKTGQEIKGKLFISNIEPKHTLAMLGENRVKKSYAKRINNIENIISCFSVHIVFKPASFPYLNYNYYHFKDETRVWDGLHYTPETWPEGYMISMSYKKGMTKWAENMTVMAYMNFEEVEEWKDTFNTVAEESERGQAYQAFKALKTAVILQEIEKKFPNIRASILSIHASTPLSYRDYIGIDKGSMYGAIKDVATPLTSILSPRTKIKNLFLTGQSINLHGVLGVTISAVLTCSFLVGREYLLNKILEANERKDNINF